MQTENSTCDPISVLDAADVNQAAKLFMPRGCTPEHVLEFIRVLKRERRKTRAGLVAASLVKGDD